MTSIENINQILEMVGGSISDIDTCKQDLEKLDDYFSLCYPDYLNPNNTDQTKKYLEEIKEEIRYFRKRTYVRTAFSYFEGILFAMKQILLDHSDKLKPNDIIRIQEFKMTGPNADNLEKAPIFVQIKDNMKFTFKKYGELKANNYQIDFECEEWETFKECVRIRNRITHPKHSNDLKVTDEELIKVELSYKWFYQNVNELQRHEI